MGQDTTGERNDIVDVLEGYVRENEPRKWAKLASTVNYRRLVLTTLREILIELRRLNQKT